VTDVVRTLKHSLERGRRRGDVDSVAHRDQSILDGSVTALGASGDLLQRVQLLIRLQLVAKGIEDQE
jgi:hypothetical protein